MPINASSPVTSTLSPKSLDEPMQEQPKASTSTSAHSPAVGNDNSEDVINTFNSDFGGLKLEDSEEKQAGEDSPDKPASNSPNTNLRQTHLGARPGAEVKKATDGKVKSSGKQATLGITEIVDKKIGERASEEAVGDRAFKYRMIQNNFLKHPLQTPPALPPLPANGLKVQGSGQHGKGSSKLYGKAGSGLDEQISTASTAKIRDEFKKNGYSDNEVNELIGRMSMARTGTEQLGWTTADGKIASHPGGLSENKDKMNEHVMAEHGTKDIERAAAVMHQFESDKSKWSMSPAQKLEHLTKAMNALNLSSAQQDQIKPVLKDHDQEMKEIHQDTSLSNEDKETKAKSLDEDTNKKIEALLNNQQKQKVQQERLKGPKQSIDNMAMLGKAYTTRHFMQPAPQLDTADPSQMKNVYHARFGQIIGNDKTGQKGVKGPGFNQWKREVHNTREREKVTAASDLIKNGYGSLVHPDMVKYLKKQKEMDQPLNNQTDLDLGPPQSQANFPSKAMSLDEMKAHNESLDEMKAHDDKSPQNPYYLIGPPRAMVTTPEYVETENTEFSSLYPAISHKPKRPRPDDSVDEASPSKRPKMDEDMRMDVD